MKLPLSKIQEQFWVLGNLYPNTPTYNIPLVYKLSGNLCVHSFKRALSRVFNTHTLLSASISMKDNSPFLNVPSALNIEDYFEDIYLDLNSSNDTFNDYILNEIHRPFRLDGGFLTRIRYISFSDAAYIVFVFHHIIIDHHSKSVFLSDISKYYSALINKTALKQNTPSGNYRSFIQSEKEWLFSDQANKMRASWKTALNDNIHQIDLPFDRNKNMTFKSQGKRIHFSLFKESSKQIDLFASSNTISPFVFLLSVYALFLARIGEQSTYAIGVPLSNRRDADFKNTFGCFVNILPLIINLDKTVTFAEIITQVRNGLLKNHRRQEISFVELQSIYNENQKGYPFHVGFTFEEPVDFFLENINVQTQNIEREGSQLELFLTMWPSATGYQGYWEFNTDKFKDKTAHRFIGIFKTILQEVLASSNKHYLDYQVLSDSDRNFIESVNNTKCAYDDTSCIHQVFEKKVLEIPDNTAVIDRFSELTYTELNTHANRLAHFLIEKGTQSGDVIAIACERRIEMIIAILAILKSGAAYLPIQILNPAEVIEEIIKNAKPKYILASSFGSINININSKNKLLSIEDLLQNPYSTNTSNPDIHVNSANIAYIIYTSGSTGVPKGVAIKHHSVINRLGWMQKSYPLTETDVLLQKTPITFDVSVWELFWWFWGGAKLSLLEPDGEKDPRLILESIKEQGITKIHFVPSMFIFFIEALKNQNRIDQIKSLQTIFCSGESLPASMVKSFQSLESPFPLAQIVNLYGPTEATVDVSYYNCPDYINDTDKLFIGRPIDNTELYIVNSSLIVQAIGIKGEVLICGANLANGYLNNKELSNKHFIQFIKPNGEQVVAYKTGDIATLHDNGEIEYIGRKDTQVKIRGIRVELGEIEAKLTKHPKISSAAVSIIIKQENKTILSYVVLVKHNSITERKLINDLKKTLSPIMMPSQIIFLDKMPLTSSGKINRQKLPKPQKHYANAKVLTKPETFYENELFCLWNKLLSTENIQITDNFYDIGGNSLLAIKLSVLIATTFPIEPDVISIMEYPTIKDYALYLENKINKKQNANDRFEEQDGNRSESMRRRFAQKRGTGNN